MRARIMAGLVALSAVAAVPSAPAAEPDSATLQHNREPVREAAGWTGETALVAGHALCDLGLQECERFTINVADDVAILKIRVGRDDCDQFTDPACQALDVRLYLDGNLMSQAGNLFDVPAGSEIVVQVATPQTEVIGGTPYSGFVLACWPPDPDGTFYFCPAITG